MNTQSIMAKHPLDLSIGTSPLSLKRWREMFKFKLFNNVGIIEKSLSKDTLKTLNSYIKNHTASENNRLAGNISKSFMIEDKNDWFFNNILKSTIHEYQQQFTKDATVPIVLTKTCRYTLDRFWVNFQKKYEFNPVHNHSGVFSFVVWMKIPSSYKKECDLPFVKNANSKCPNTFSLLFINSLGDIAHLDYNLEPSDEGRMLFFSSRYSHCVYPFYLSNKERISISGNIYLDPRKIVSNV